MGAVDFLQEEGVREETPSRKVRRYCASSYSAPHLIQRVMNYLEQVMRSRKVETGSVAGNKDSAGPKGHC